MADKMWEAFSSDSGSKMLVKEAGFRSNLERYAEKVASDYTGFNVDMNQSIAKIASREHLNKEQIQRIVEESNNRVYLAKYAKLKTQNEREVTFDRADAEKVASFSESHPSDGEQFIKSAGVARDAFNSTRNLTGALTPTAPTALTKLMAEKLASDLSAAAEACDNANVNFDAHIYKVAEMMVRYDRHGVDTKKAFESICIENELRIPMQKMIHEAAEEIVEMEKLAGRVNQDYKINLPLVDTGIARKDFSLGALSKIASMNFIDKEDKAFPVIRVGKILIRSVSDMVKFASQIIPLGEAVIEKDSLFKVASEKATFEKAGE